MKQPECTALSTMFGRSGRVCCHIITRTTTLKQSNALTNTAAVNMLCSSSHDECTSQNQRFQCSLWCTVIVHTIVDVFRHSSPLHSCSSLSPSSHLMHHLGVRLNSRAACYCSGSTCSQHLHISDNTRDLRGPEPRMRWLKNQSVFGTALYT